MARTNNLTNFLTDVASAIKEKKGSQTAIPAANFDTEIRNLPGGGGGIQPITITYPGHEAFTPTSSITSDPQTNYGFDLVNGWYRSNNQNEDGTTASCIVTINTPQEFDLIIKCKQSSEADFDFGAISQVDSRALGISLRGLNGNRNVEVTIPQGEHTLYIGYTKDGSDFSGDDQLEFQLDFSNCVAVPDETYTINVMHFANQAAMQADTQCPIDTFAIVYGYGRNLQSEVYRKTANGWIFTGVSNDPNLIPKNIVRGIKIGEVTGAYVEGYPMDEDGNLIMPNVTNVAYEIEIDGHTNSFRFLSGYIDPLERMHIRMQYETYASIPLVCTIVSGESRIAHFTAPNSEGVTSTMEIVIPNTNYQRFVYTSLNASQQLAVDAVYEVIDNNLDVIFPSDIALPTGCTLSAVLLYNDTFDLYKVGVTLSNNVDPQQNPDFNKSLNVNYLVEGFDETIPENIKNVFANYHSSTYLETNAFASANQPSSITVTNGSMGSSLHISGEGETEISGVTYDYAVSSDVWINMNLSSYANVIQGNISSNSNDIPVGDFTLVIEYTLNMGLKTLVQTSNLNAEVPYSNNMIEVPISETGITRDTFFTTNFSGVISSLELYYVETEEVLDETSWSVYNNHDLVKASISDLLISGERINGYDITGTLSYNGSYVLKVYKDNTKAQLLGSVSSSDPNLSFHISPFNITDYDFQDIYFVIEREGVIEDNEWYDAQNPNVTLNQDGSADYDGTFNLSNLGITYRITAHITPQNLIDTWGIQYTEYVTINDLSTFLDKMLSQKGYEAQQAGTLGIVNLPLKCGENRNYNYDTVNVNVIGNNNASLGYSFMVLIPNLRNDTASNSFTHFGIANMKILSMRNIEITPVTNRSNISPVKPGSDISDDGSANPTEEFYDNGVVYFTVTRNKDDIYDFTDNQDGTYSRQTLTAAYAYEISLPAIKRWDSDYNLFTTKYFNERAYNYADSNANVYALLSTEFPWQVHNVIIRDPDISKYIAGDYCPSGGRDTILQYEVDGETLTTEDYARVINSPFYNNQNVYYCMDGIMTPSANNAVEIPKSN